MPTNYPKRLIEVDLPIKRISAHARREKSIRHGHISTLHIWWARRPLAACRAVICAALWPDPADPICPEAFVKTAKTLMLNWAKNHQKKASAESFNRLTAINKNPKVLDDPMELRKTLLDFIADFANWDNSTDADYLETSRTLTQTAHEALGGIPGTKPLVVDPFAGGGAIPLEALRVGADAFASDLNPVAVLLNKVVLEYIPKYGQQLADEVRKWGQWVKEEAEKELAEFYPKDPDGATPIAYLWARTITCEGPNCGIEIPLIKSHLLDSKRSEGNVYIDICNNYEKRTVQTAVNCVPPISSQDKITNRGWAVTCPLCEYTTLKKQVQKQITRHRGGATNAKLLAVVLSHPHRSGKLYREPHQKDLVAIEAAEKAIEQYPNREILTSLSAKLPSRNSHRAVGSQLPLYGFGEYRDLYTPRQKLALASLTKAIKQIPIEKSNIGAVIYDLMAICLAKQADYSTSLCRWRHDGAYVNPTLGGEKKYVMISDFAESCPLSHGSGNWLGQVDWVARFLAREASGLLNANGQAIQASSDQSGILPEDAASALITDPPYYDCVPYSDLANFYYVWLQSLLQESYPDLFWDQVTPKEKEMTVDHPNNEEEKESYRQGLERAFSVGRLTTYLSGIGVIVFAHKSTSGWEALLAAIIDAGWSIVASWPVDTELQNRLNAIGTASLASSVHLICRPRNTNDIGDWRDVLQELPQRIHEWMPRLAAEGVVGADAIFACLGPALEIFSRYSRVEKASGEQVTLKEYLEYVWAAVSKEALGMIFSGADATGFEEDARLTAMWFWTLSSGSTDNTNDSSETEAEDEDEETSSKSSKTSGYVLEFDAARKIAQGLGAHLENLNRLVEVKGDKARLLPVSERTHYLFGKEEAQAPTKRQKKDVKQLSLFEIAGNNEDEDNDWGEKTVPSLGNSTLDRIHQSMILFAAGRSEALKRFLVEEGAGTDQRFWRLAQALSALYPNGTDEKRWVDGVLARKKGLGF